MAKGTVIYVPVLALVFVFLLDSAYSSDIQHTMAPERAKQAMESAKDTATDAINKGQDGIMGAAGSAKDTANDAINKGQEAMSDVTGNSFADLAKGFFGGVFGGKDEEGSEASPAPAPAPIA